MLLEEWTLEKEVEVRKQEAGEDGGEKRAIKIAQKMKAQGKSINEIMELTELTVDEVLRL